MGTDDFNPKDNLTSIVEKKEKCRLYDSCNLYQKGYASFKMIQNVCLNGGCMPDSSYTEGKCPYLYAYLFLDDGK